IGRESAPGHRHAQRLPLNRWRVRSPGDLGLGFVPDGTRRARQRLLEAVEGGFVGHAAGLLARKERWAKGSVATRGRRFVERASEHTRFGRTFRSASGGLKKAKTASSKELQGGVRSEHADQYRISRGGGVRADGGFLAGDLAPDRIVDLSGEVAREAGNI